MKRPMLAALCFAFVALAPTASAASAQASIADRAFLPAQIEVEPGSTLTWTNADDDVHTVTATGGAFSSGDISPGGTFSVTFDAPGRFAYRCIYHGRMVGAVVVRTPTEPDAAPPEPSAENDTGAPQPEPAPVDAQAPSPSAPTPEAPATPDAPATPTPPTPETAGSEPEPTSPAVPAPAQPLVDVDAQDLGRPLQGTVALRGHASGDAGAPLRVQLSIDNGPWLDATGSAAWTFAWDTTSVPDGAHLVSVRAEQGGVVSRLVWQNVVVDNARAPASFEAEGTVALPFLSVPLALCVVALAAFARRFRRRPP